MIGFPRILVCYGYAEGDTFCSGRLQVCLLSHPSDSVCVQDQGQIKSPVVRVDRAGTFHLLSIYWAGLFRLEPSRTFFLRCFFAQKKTAGITLAAYVT